MKKKVIIHAYTKLNLGDDLFIKILCERYPQTNFYLYAPKEYKRLFANIDNLNIFPNNNVIVKLINYTVRTLKINDSIFRTILGRKCDAAVYIGGSLFMQKENWKQQVKKLKDIHLKGKPFFLLGANFGPYTDDLYFQVHKEIFSGFTDVCFRDSYSYNLFNKLGNVRKADDIIFQLNHKAHNKNLKSRTIVISVIKPSLRPHMSMLDDKYYKKIRDIIVYFGDKGYHSNLMSFCEGEGDNQAISEIRKLVPQKYLNMVSESYYKYNIDEIINETANSAFVIATRFHSMVLGWLFNKPVFPLVYSKKMTNVMTDVGFKGEYSEIEQINDLAPRTVYESMKKNYIDVEDQIKNSEIQFEKLDSFLKEYKNS